MSEPSDRIAEPSDRIATVPNALSALRLLGVPLFVYLLLGPHSDGWAVVILFVSGATDWLDGKLARILDQTSKFGALLDPFVDRVYVVSTLVTFVIRGIIPWWVAVLLIGRDLVLAATLPIYRARGLPPPDVIYLGKAATFVLMVALPVLLLGQFTGSVGSLFSPIGYALLIWGTALYLWTGLIYLRNAVGVFRSTPASVEK